MAERTAPVWVRALSLAIPARYREEIVIDLLDEHAALTDRGRSPAYAMRWLAGHLLLSIGAAWRHHPRMARPEHPGASGFVRHGPGPGRALRQAARSVRRTPWYALTIVAIVAMSIALASTVFAVVDGVLFRPLPYPDAHELYAVGGVFGDDVEPSERGIELLSNREVTTWSTDAPDVVWTGLSYTSMQLPDGAVVHAVGVDSRFFDVFGARMAIGGFGDGQLRPIPQESRTPEIVPAVISHQVWQEHFDGDPSVLGRVIRPPGFLAIPYEIVGVLTADGFVPPLAAAPLASLQSSRKVEMIVPWMSRPDFGERGMVAYARVPDGQLPATKAALDRAAAAYAPTVAPLAATLTPGQRRARAPYVAVEFQPLRAYLTQRERPLFAIAFIAVVGLIAIVLLNAGALAGARATHQLTEISLRRALGARPRDLLRDAVAEQAVLAVPGVLTGLALCPVLLAMTRELLPPGLTLIKDASVDWRVAIFAGLVTCATSALVALFPLRVALRRRDLSSTRLVRHEDRRRGLSRWLVAGQVALAFLMVLGGVFFTTSMARVWNEDAGFRTRDAALVMVYANDFVSRREFAEVASTLRSAASVEAAAPIDASLLRPYFEGSLYRLPGADALPDYRPAAFDVGSGFFDATGIRLISGRMPSDAELDAGAPVVAVSEAVAREYWSGRSAVGQTLLDARRQPVTVVGVVGDVRWQAPDFAPEGAIYGPYLDADGRRRAAGAEFFVTFDGDMKTALGAAVDRVGAAHSGFRVAQVRTVEDALVEAVRARRFSALTASVFGVVALVFVTVGLLGLVAMTASHRTREVGIRMALGARPGGIVRQLVREQLGAVFAGLACGAVAAVWAVRFVQAHLYDTTPSDPAVWVTTVSVLLAAAVLGSAVPAMRASRIDPVRALRVD